MFERIKESILRFLRGVQTEHQQVAIPEIIHTQNWRQVIQPKFVLQLKRSEFGGADLGYFIRDGKKVPAVRKNGEVEEVSEECFFYGIDLEENHAWDTKNKCWYPC